MSATLAQAAGLTPLHNEMQCDAKNKVVPDTDTELPLPLSLDPLGVREQQIQCSVHRGQNFKLGKMNRTFYVYNLCLRHDCRQISSIPVTPHREPTGIVWDCSFVQLIQLPITNRHGRKDGESSPALNTVKLMNEVCILNGLPAIAVMHTAIAQDYTTGLGDDCTSDCCAFCAFLTRPICT